MAWGDIDQGDFVWGDFGSGGFCPRGILSGGILSRGFLSRGILSRGILSCHHASTDELVNRNVGAEKQLQDVPMRRIRHFNPVL